MNLLELFSPIRAFVFDADGVLTDNQFTLTEEGHKLRSINIKDEYAIQQAVKNGYKIWVISDTDIDTFKPYLSKAGINEIHSSVPDKTSLLTTLASNNKLSYETLLYMGDDLPDYHAMQQCGLPCCPHDAAPEIREAAKYISPFNGGKGCIRDVIEKVLKLNGNWTI